MLNDSGISWNDTDGRKTYSKEKRLREDQSCQFKKKKNTGIETLPPRCEPETFVLHDLVFVLKEAESVNIGVYFILKLGILLSENVVSNIFRCVNFSQLIF